MQGLGCFSYLAREADRDSQYIFLIYGAVTILTGAVVFVALPDSPAKAWFFNEKEKSAVIVRLAANQTGVDTHKVSLIALKFISLYSYLHFVTEHPLVVTHD